MSHILVKLVTGAVIFGGREYSNSNEVVISKPYTFVYQTIGDNDKIGIAPYDAGSVQFEMESINIPINNILYYTDMSDAKELREAYISITTGILMKNKSIII